MESDAFAWATGAYLSKDKRFFLNGQSVVYTKGGLESAILQAVNEATGRIQETVYYGQLQNWMNVLDFLMDNTGGVTNRLSQSLSISSAPLLDFTGSVTPLGTICGHGLIHEA